MYKGGKCSKDAKLGERYVQVCRDGEAQVSLGSVFLTEEMEIGKTIEGDGLYPSREACQASLQ